MIQNQPPQSTNSLTFQFLSTIHSKHLNCKLCQKLMLQPIHLHPCGHTFCISCVQNKSIKQCPICLLKINAKQKDILASKLVGELGVRCLNSGCPWKGSFQEFRNFHEKGCGLKNGGIDAWLKQLQNTISQNTMGFSHKIQQNQQEDQQKQKQQQNQKVKPSENHLEQQQKQKKTIPLGFQSKLESNDDKTVNKSKSSRKKLKKSEKKEIQLIQQNTDELLQKRMKKFTE